MHDLDYAILDAWARVEPILRSNPDELARRLARRHSGTMSHPPRSWCCAVRASDTRINEATCAIVPEWARYPHLNPYHHDRYANHEVTLYRESLVRLCAAVNIAPPGEVWTDVAKKLGVHEETLRPAMRQGIFEVRWIKGLGGRPGKPVPVLYSPRTFDPACANFRARPDGIWGAMWAYLTDLVPKDFEQTIEREPEYRLYPDGRARGLGAPFRHRFRGWRWRCPACRELVRTIFLPLPPINLPTFFGLEKHRDENHPDAIQPPPPCFACVRCHRIKYFSRINRSSWDNLVAHVSGGLLYGSEVKRPDWLTPDRKKNYTPQVNRAPSKRREEVEKLLLKGWSRKQIAKEMGLKPSTIASYAEAIYRQYGLRGGRKALAKRMGVKLARARRSDKYQRSTHLRV